MKKLLYLFFTVILIFTQTFASSFHVTTSGLSSGNGSISNPWNLQTALNHPSTVKPGDTIWVHGGTYRGYFKSYLNGTAANPIIVRQYPGEHAAIDGGNSQQEDILRVNGNYTWYWGFEIFSSDLSRYTNATGSFPPSSDIRRGTCINSGNDLANVLNGNKFIHLAIHDGFNGFGAWVPSHNELYGCILYNNGWGAPDRPHGHNIYAQNELGGERKFIANLIWGAFENNIQAYGTRYTDDFYFEKNISYSGAGDGRDYLIGGGGVSHNLVMIDNYSYEVAGQNLNIGWYPYGGGMDNSKVTGNYIIGGEVYFYNMAANTVITGNTFSATYYQPGNIPSLYPNNTYITGIPNKVFIFPSKYEPGRGNIAIYNGALASFVSVDISNIVKIGEKFLIQDAQNFYGPAVLSGVYNGGSVSIPMASRTVAQPIGGDSKNGARISSFPKFAALVIMSASSGGIQDAPILNNNMYEYSLEQNYPNPFNPTTRINFTLKNGGFTSLVIRDVLGQELIVVVNQVLPPGTHSYVVDASKLSSGIYFYILKNQGFITTKKMILVK